MDLSTSEIIYLILSLIFSFIGSIMENLKLVLMTQEHYKLASVFAPLTLLFITLSSSFAVVFSSASGTWWFILVYAAISALFSFMSTMVSKVINHKFLKNDNSEDKEDNDKDKKAETSENLVSKNLITNKEGVET
ncbi:MAG: hypothetical protein HRS57_00340 [Mycoplasmataceae bacterium]|nr:hypothetical protein [Mycoplasmataceae bacterium]